MTRSEHWRSFGTHLVTQVLECSSSSPTKQIRFILNDAVIPLTYEVRHALIYVVTRPRPATGLQLGSERPLRLRYRPRGPAQAR